MSIPNPVFDSAPEPNSGQNLPEVKLIQDKPQGGESTRLCQECGSAWALPFCAPFSSGPGVSAREGCCWSALSEPAIGCFASIAATKCWPSIPAPNIPSLREKPSDSKLSRSFSITGSSDGPGNLQSSSMLSPVKPGCREFGPVCS